jgi:Rrf2 family protein
MKKESGSLTSLLYRTKIVLIMNITRETDYAVRCVLRLSETPDEVVMADDLAAVTSVSKPFLAKILQKLTKAGIVRSFRGVKGGFRLTRRPKDITLLDVIEAIEGAISMNKCVVDQRFCELHETCTVHPVWVGIRTSVEELLKGYNFEFLVSNIRR